MTPEKYSSTPTSPNQAGLTQPSDASYELVIESYRRFGSKDFEEVWRARELLWIFALRDIKLRYKQTLLGAAWALLQPLATMLIFCVLFGFLIAPDKLPTTSGVPYAISTFCGLLPWQLFANAVTASGTSLVANQGLISKVYFPRMIIPIAPIIAGLLDFLVSMSLLSLMMAYVGIRPDWQLLCLPLFLALAVLAAMGLGLWLSALNAMYRDIVYTLPVMLQIGMFLSPVVYNSAAITSHLSPWLQVAYGLNPMVCVIEGFRWTLLNASPPPINLLAISTVASLLLFISGALYFRRMEQTLADWI